MHLSYREWWALIHGIIFGAFFLLAFSGGLAGLWSLRTEWVTTEGLRERVRRLKIGTVTMALAAWAPSSPAPGSSTPGIAPSRPIAPSRS